MCIGIRVFDLILLVNMSAFMPIPSFFHYCSFIIELDVRDGDASVNSFFFFFKQDCFGYPGFFVFPYDFECCSFKDCDEYFYGDCIESIDCFWF